MKQIENLAGKMKLEQRLRKEFSDNLDYSREEKKFRALLDKYNERSFKPFNEICSKIFEEKARANIGNNIYLYLRAISCALLAGDENRAYRILDNEDVNFDINVYANAEMGPIKKSKPGDIYIDLRSRNPIQALADGILTRYYRSKGKAYKREFTSNGRFINS